MKARLVINCRTCDQQFVCAGYDQDLPQAGDYMKHYLHGDPDTYMMFSAYRLFEFDGFSTFTITLSVYHVSDDWAKSEEA